MAETESLAGVHPEPGSNSLKVLWMDRDRNWCGPLSSYPALHKMPY